jgi:hypothetical protein
MPKSNNRKYTKLHCQHCAKLRQMISFMAVNTEPKEGQKPVVPIELRLFMEKMHSDTMVHLPRFYAAVCATCLKKTFYQGRHRGFALDVIPT